MNSKRWYSINVCLQKMFLCFLLMILALWRQLYIKIIWEPPEQNWYLMSRWVYELDHTIRGRATIWNCFLMITNANLLEKELPTLPKHMTSPHCFRGVRGVLVIQFLVFTFLVPCSDVRRISASTCSFRHYSHLCCRRFMIDLLFVFIYNTICISHDVHVV